MPINARTAQQIGLIEATFREDAASFRHRISQLVEKVAQSPRYAHLLKEMRHVRKPMKQAIAGVPGGRIAADVAEFLWS